MTAISNIPIQTKLYFILVQYWGQGMKILVIMEYIVVSHG